ncbi:FtsX-like permease family protein [Streptomyces paromomycinus]|uniref:Membrane protein n=1 Tax=Streptomyces paromomycinus TaxID=92743 RepID=A0A401W1X9_STREY|nr:FtsX-like permease family protein [Streptomyces paromomycinus]GCD43327.1 membrane protein [Streptomyces paromomycinus]
MEKDRRHLVGRWCRDLGMGARFAVGGGREAWVRTALTALGVGLGVAVLLIAAAVPHAVSTAVGRDKARSDTFGSPSTAVTDRTLLVAQTDTAYQGRSVRGRLVRADGDRPATPPGVPRLPGPGEMVVSPALADLLASSDGVDLRERFRGVRTVGRIGTEGLTGPSELAYYQGSDRLTDIRAGTTRIASFGGGPDSAFPTTNPQLLLSILVGSVALLVPVAVFIAAAVRFGGERRDRRLAALRLVGTDRATTRRIAAGEALAGALLGLLTGAVVFLAARYPLSGIRVLEFGIFPSDVVPDWRLAALVASAVPACSVGVALLTMRRITVEPLGVTRSAPPVRRRLWWRLLLPVAGVALLWPMTAGHKAVVGFWAGAQVVAGTSLLLLGVAALLPWLLDAVVSRIGAGGGPSWQLAVRRLQLSTTAAARSVSGITVAVAGVVAVQLLLAGVQVNDLPDPLPAPREHQMAVADRDGELPVAGAPGMYDRLRGTAGVRSVYGAQLSFAGPLPSEGRRAPAGNAPGEESSPVRYRLVVADCDALRRMVRTDRCADGDAFYTPPKAFREDGTETGLPASDVPPVPRPGTRLAVSPDAGNRPATWTVPHTVRTVDTLPSFFSLHEANLLATPGALDPALLRSPSTEAEVHLDPDRPEAVEYVRNTAAQIDPRLQAMPLWDDFAGSSERDPELFDIVRAALQAGAMAVLCLIGAGLLISVLEQLRERRLLLSALDAFGTPRRTLGRSVLWQTAVPVVLGLALAVGCGLGVGLLLLHLVGKPMLPDWPGIAVLTGTAGAVILAVTALSLPLLWRLMRPDGLRTE